MMGEDPLSSEAGAADAGASSVLDDVSLDASQADVAAAADTARAGAAPQAAADEAAAAQNGTSAGEAPSAAAAGAGPAAGAGGSGAPAPPAAQSVATSEVSDLGEAPGGSGGGPGLKVTVTDPLKRSESGALGRSYVTYKVTTSATLPAYRTAQSGGSMVVRRRFRDFVRLHDALCEAHRGFFVPPRPEKDALASSSDQEFVEFRRHLLEQWLNRLAQHPVLASSPHLVRFLETDGDLPSTASVRSAMASASDAASTLGSQVIGSAAANTPADAAVAAKASRNPLRSLKEWRQGMMNDLGSKAGLQEEDTEYLAHKLAFGELEKLLSDSSGAAEGVVQSLQDMSDANAALGLELIKLAKFEEASEHEAIAPALKALGGSLVRQSRLQRSATGQAVQVLQPLHEHLGIMPAVHAASADRAKALLTVQTLASDIERKRLAVAKLEARSGAKLGGDAGITGKLTETGRELAAAEASSVVAKEQYELIKTRNKGEFERLNAERKQAFTKMLVQFAKSQANFYDRSASLYSAGTTDIELAASGMGKGKAAAAAD